MNCRIERNSGIFWNKVMLIYFGPVLNLRPLLRFSSILQINLTVQRFLVVTRKNKKNCLVLFPVSLFYEVSKHF